MPQLALLGVLTGLVTALVILVFRLLVENGGAMLLNTQSGESFEALDVVYRVALCLGGAALLAFLLNRYNPSARRVGVVHVMERLMDMPIPSASSSGR